MKVSTAHIKTNLATRLQLLKSALFRRHIYAAITNIAREHGLGYRGEYRDIVGNIQPLQFVRHIANRAPHDPKTQLDFPMELASAADFTPEGEPEFYNSEPTVSRFLAELVFAISPRCVVELGCFVGWTSAHLAYALSANDAAGRLYCVDASQKYLDVTVANLERIGLRDAATMVLGTSLDSKVLSSLPKNIDVLFIDTSHRYPDTLNEIKEYARRMAPGGYIVLHDSISWPGVRRSLVELSPSFQTLTFATESGNGVSVLFVPY